MTLDFRRDNCDQIGYQDKNKSRGEDPLSDLPSIQNPCSLSSVVIGTIGQYGNDFKTSTMRLGADVIVFTQSASDRSSSQSIGLFLYTFLRKTGQDNIIVPMVDFELPSDHGTPRMLVHNTKYTKTRMKPLHGLWEEFDSGK